MLENIIEIIKKAPVKSPRFLEALELYEKARDEEKSLSQQDKVAEVEIFTTLSKRFCVSPAQLGLLIAEIGPCRIMDLFNLHIATGLFEYEDPEYPLFVGYAIAHVALCKDCGGEALVTQRLVELLKSCNVG